MKLRNFDKVDAEIFAGAVNPVGIAEFENEETGDAYVIVVDSYGLTLSRFAYDGDNDFVTIEMLPSQALLLVQMLDVNFEAFDSLIEGGEL